MDARDPRGLSPDISRKAVASPTVASGSSWCARWVPGRVEPLGEDVDMLRAAKLE